MSSVARSLGVTTGTLTIAVNSLVKKGYVERARSEEDRRVVLVSLSEKGKRAYLHHRQFHEQMIEAIVEELSEEEQAVLEKALVNRSNRAVSSFLSSIQQFGQRPEIRGTILQQKTVETIEEGRVVIAPEGSGLLF